MLTNADTRVWAAVFGAAPEQIVTDHLVSHVIAAIGAGPPLDQVVLLGGTALARTHLADRRLSEDIDLWAESATATFEALALDLPRRLRREFPGCRVEQEGPQTGSLLTRAGMRLRVQVVTNGAEHQRCVAVERRPVGLRYSDLPEAVGIRVPTLPGLVAMKHLAWAERAAPRDLADLAGLAEAGALDADAAAVVRCLSGFGITDHEVRQIPDHTRGSWAIDLAHQMRQVPDPDDALRLVRRAWGRALGWT